MVARVRHIAMKPHRFSIIAFAATLLFVAAGCGGASDGPAADSAEMTWTRTGGIAGVDITVAVSDSGKWTMADAKQDESSKGKLDADELEELKTLVTSDELRSKPPSSDDSSCADVFHDRLVASQVDLETSCGKAPNQAFADIVQLLKDVTGV